MFHNLINIVFTCALATSALARPRFTRSTTLDPLAPVENGTLPDLPFHLDSKVAYRQASRDSILSRAESRRAASRGRALQPRQSARVYPTCSSGTPNSIPQSGFVNFPGYSIDTNSANLLDGYFLETSPEISCVMLCEITSGCTAGYWAGGNTCYLKTGTVAGTAMVPRPGTDRVSFIRGDCASLEGQINDSTIMSACCNNPPPSTINRCTASEYQNLGNYCVQTRNQYTTANRITTLTVAGGTDFNAVLRNCAQYCTTYTANGRTSNSRVGCTIATASYNTNGGPNCAIYGGRLLTMSSSDAPFTLALIAGTCEQFTASTISQREARGGCYSPVSGP